MEEYTSRNDVTISSNDVILPAEKKITLQPVHVDVHVDDESDVQVAASHANGAPIGNITGDRESTGIDNVKTPTPTATTTVSSQQPATTTPIRHRSYRSIIVMAIIIAILLFALLHR